MRVDDTMVEHPFPGKYEAHIQVDLDQGRLLCTFADDDGNRIHTQHAALIVSGTVADIWAAGYEEGTSFHVPDVPLEVGYAYRRAGEILDDAKAASRPYQKTSFYVQDETGAVVAKHTSLKRPGTVGLALWSALTPE